MGKKCPSCGACQECGHRPTPYVPYVPYVPNPYPYWYWSTLRPNATVTVGNQTITGLSNMASH